MIVGVDLSLTATGLALPHHTLTITSRKRGIERLHDIATQLHTHITPAHHVYIEGYAYGRPNQAAHLGELGGVIRLELWRKFIPYTDIPPAVLKKFATGRGNAGKEQVLAEAIRRLGYTGSSFDEADALWLRAIGCHIAGTPLCQLPAAHVAALDKIKGEKP